jgi:hypothetical protein
MLNITEDLKNNKYPKVAGDASFRNFYRIKIKNKKYILIYCRKQKKINLDQYSKVNLLLRKFNLLAPRLYELNLKANYMIIEDFGDKTFFQLMKKNTNRLKYYKKIVDTLVKIQSIKINSEAKKIINKVYNVKVLMKESNLFFQWFATRHVHKSKIRIFKKKAKSILSSIFSTINFPNTYFVHRDFHVSNLMSYQNKVGIIDSQDALMGNPAYDIVSLIDDVRIKTSSQLKQKIFEYYLIKSNSNFRKKISLFKNDFDILSVQRALKIIGIFNRLYFRDGKKNYLSLVPYTWSLLHHRLKNPIFSKLNAVFNQYIPLEKRK